MSAGRQAMAALPRGWLLKTELLLIDGDNKPLKSLWISFFSGCQAYRDQGEEGTPDDHSNKACLNRFLCLSSSADTVVQNESRGLSTPSPSVAFHKGDPRQELSSEALGNCSPESHSHVERGHSRLGPSASPSTAPLCSLPHPAPNTKWTNIYLP